MAIAFNAAADLGIVASGTSFSASYTVGSGSNRLLTVGFIGDYTTLGGGGGYDDITSVTYNGVAMTLAVKLIDNSQATANRYSYLYYLLDPPSGANTVAVTWTNSHYLAAIAADYTGVAQSGQPDAATTNFQDGGGITTLTTSITTVANDDWAILIEGGYNAGAPPIAGAGDTLRTYDATYGTPGLFDSNGAITPSGAYSMTTTRSSASQAISHIIAAFAPVSSVTVTADSGAPAEFLLSQAPPPIQIELMAAVTSERSTASEALATAGIEPSILVELLGPASVAVTGDTSLAIEAGATPRSDRGVPIEPAALMRSDHGPTAEVLATNRTDAGAGLSAEALTGLAQDASPPIEWLGTGAILIADAMLQLEWQRTTPSVLLSLESGPDRIRLLATPGRVRLVRRN